MKHTNLILDRHERIILRGAVIEKKHDVIRQLAECDGNGIDEFLADDIIRLERLLVKLS